MTEAQILMNVFQETRSLSNFYFNKQKDSDVYQVFEVDGKPLNSAAWIMAHLAWAENFLILQAMNGPALNEDWFSKVAFGAPMAKKEELPEIDTILSVLNKVHETSQAFVNNLTAAELDTNNVLGMKFGPNTSKRYMLIHAIRHEGVHAGHLGWLCKLNAKKTL
jgi:hypothetical protein